MKSKRPKSSASDHFPANKVLWTLTVQATAVLPHIAHVPSWILLVAALVGMWRYQASRRQWRSPSLTLRLFLVAIGCFGVYLSYGTLLGRDAGVALIILMLALKLLELNRRRDVVLFILLGYFLVVTNFLYSQTVAMAAYMFVVTVLLTSALVTVSDPGWRVRPAAHLRIASVLLIQSIPIALLLFVLFPRISGPLWRLPEDAHSGSTGLSSQMSPGSFSHLVRSDAVAFRVDFHDLPPPKSRMYWRGPVMEYYDGQSWFATAIDSERDEVSAPDIGSVAYQVTLEANGQPWLLALDVPLAAPPGASLNGEYEVRASSPVQVRTRYEMRSAVRSGRGIGGTLPAAQRRMNLQLPPGSDPKARTLARNLAATNRQPSAIIAAVLERFRTQHYVYTLDPPLSGKDKIDDFLFGSRRGFCEHYAGAFVFLMRAAGIPARVVTGYQGGEYNPNGSYWIIRQSDAHAWAEVWLAQRGWMRIDPTAAISPLRIEQGIDAALPQQTGYGRDSIPLIHNIGLLWDSANNRWNQWVLGYGSQKQLELMRSLGLGQMHWLNLALITALTVAIALALLAAGMALRHRRPKLQPVARAWQVFCRKLTRIGIARMPYEGPTAFVSRAMAQRPDLASQLAEIGELYTDLQYAADGGGRKSRELIQRVAGFSAHRKPCTQTQDAPVRIHTGARPNPDQINN